MAPRTDSNSDVSEEIALAAFWPPPDEVDGADKSEAASPSSSVSSGASSFLFSANYKYIGHKVNGNICISIHIMHNVNIH